VDEVTQWEIVASVEKISEAYLVPVLESMLVQFPFIIRGFHSDNGGEFVNHIVAKLLNKNPYINFHRSCFFPVSVIDHKGKIKKTYPYEEVMIPYERLRTVPKAESYLRPGVSLEKLGTIANQMSDNQFAERMVNARSKLFQQITRFAKTSCLKPFPSGSFFD